MAPYPDMAPLHRVIDEVRRMGQRLAPMGCRPTAIAFIVTHEGPNRTLRKRFVRRVRSWEDIPALLRQFTRAKNAGVDTLRITYSTPLGGRA